MHCSGAQSFHLHREGSSFAGPRQRRPCCNRRSMPVIAIVNRKGGSGKSTLATHLAACFANRGVAVMLGDVDRQQSTQGWLRMRGSQAPATSAPIVGWAVDPKRVLRPPAGVSLVVLDTPGGLHGFDLARVASFADVILMPVCNSAFNRESAADCHAELMALPRVASGRCKVAAVGMRLDARTRAAETLATWAADRKLPFVAALRETQVYVRGIERGPHPVRSAGREERRGPRPVAAARRLARADPGCRAQAGDSSQCRGHSADDGSFARSRATAAAASRERGRAGSQARATRPCELARLACRASLSSARDLSLNASSRLRLLPAPASRRSADRAPPGCAPSAAR